MEVGVETSRLSIGGAELGVLRVTETVVGTKVRRQLLYAVVCIMSNKSFRAKIYCKCGIRPRMKPQLVATPTFLSIAQHSTVPITIMLAPLRIRVSILAPICQPYILSRRHYATRERNSDGIPTNDPSPPKPVQNVSDSNAIPISPQGMRDSSLPLQEMPEDSERQRVMQAPNRKEPWSRSQQPRERAMSGPRFEQTIMEYQVGCRADMALFRRQFYLGEYHQLNR